MSDKAIALQRVLKSLGVDGRTLRKAARMVETGKIVPKLPKKVIDRVTYLLGKKGSAMITLSARGSFRVFTQDSHNALKESGKKAGAKNIEKWKTGKAPVPAAAK